MSSDFSTFIRTATKMRTHCPLYHTIESTKTPRHGTITSLQFRSSTHSLWRTTRCLRQPLGGSARILQKLDRKQTRRYVFISNLLHHSTFAFHWLRVRWGYHYRIRQWKCLATADTDTKSRRQSVSLKTYSFAYTLT